MLSILLLCFLSSAQESACRAVDLSASVGPARDQDYTGWCFANTTADLVSQKLGFRVSSADVALTHHLSDPQKVKTALKKDISPEVLKGLNIPSSRDSDILNIKPKDMFSYIKKSQAVKHKGLMNFGGDEDYALLASSVRGFCKEAQLPSGASEDLRNLDELQQYAKANPSFPDDENFRSIKNSQLRQKMIAAWKWSNEKCGQRVFPQAPLVPKTVSIADDVAAIRGMPKSLKAKKQKELLASIDRDLSSQKAVAVGMDVNELTTKEWADGQVEHSVIIIGRKMVDGKCMHLVRNSSGKDCSVFLKKFNPAKNCVPEYGAIWMDLAQMPSLYSAISIRGEGDPVPTPAPSAVVQ